MTKEGKTNKSPADGISFILPTGEYITARIGNSSKANRAVYAIFWKSWGDFYRNHRSTQVGGSHPHHKK